MDASDSDHDHDQDRIDVAIIGGGPVGVATALMCHHHGLRVEVFERTHDVYPLPRAVAMDDEIQRALANIGLGEQLAQVTVPLTGAEFVNPAGNRLVGGEFPVDANWPLGFHPVVMYHQPTLESMLRSALSERAIAFHRGFDVQAIREDTAGGVGLDVLSATGTKHRRSSRWVIAADGASSQTRRQLGVDLTDLGFDQEWIVVDVLMRRDAGLKRLSQQVCDPNRVVTLVPGFGQWRRWEFQMKPHERGADLNTPDGLTQLLRPWISPDDGSVERSAVYRFHATVSAQMRVGSVFLAGDSAHQMPPFLGQGLCSGMRDGANLAWKLGMVNEGRADDSLLDTYHDERLPHATSVVHHAVDTGRLIDHLARTGDDTDTSAGYGGGRPFPILKGGLLLDGHPAIGRQIANPRLPGGGRLDELLGNGFSFVTAPARVDAVNHLVRTRFARLQPTVIGVEPNLLPMTIGPDTAAFVRPDRSVAAVVDLVDDPSADGLHHLLERYGLV